MRAATLVLRQPWPFLKGADVMLRTLRYDVGVKVKKLFGDGRFPGSRIAVVKAVEDIATVAIAWLRGRPGVVDTAALDEVSALVK
jgi:hypothetical protein